jgi:hypothetical protein
MASVFARIKEVEFDVIPDITYKTIQNQNLKLDIYKP